MSKPSLFVGSSSEGLEVARAVEVQLQDAAEVTLWNEGFFGLSHGTLESLVNNIERFDFAILVATPDDMVTRRDESALSARDNVLFELGLFMGRLGRGRTYLLADPRAVRLPTDLAGVTIATYDSARRDQNLIAAVGPATTVIRNTIKDLGPAIDKGFGELERATDQVVGISSLMERLIHLLARSRAVELKVISEQFGPLIRNDFLKQMLEDLDDLQKSTRANPESAE
jgi:Predicted nucleotide-binding protein containing TIR-like domain